VALQASHPHLCSKERKWLENSEQAEKKINEVKRKAGDEGEWQKHKGRITKTKAYSISRAPSRASFCGNK